MAKTKLDQKLVSSDYNEIRNVSKRFQGAPVETIALLQTSMRKNFGRCERDNLYHVLLSIGYGYTKTSKGTSKK